MALLLLVIGADPVYSLAFGGAVFGVSMIDLKVPLPGSWSAFVLIALALGTVVVAL